MTLIFFFSAETGAASGARSAIIAQWITQLGLIDDPEIATLVVRKAAHFVIYAVLGMLAIWVAELFIKKVGWGILLSILFAFLYAASDELHQLLVAERAGQFTDVLLDTAGAAVGVLLKNGIHSRAVPEARGF